MTTTLSSHDAGSLPQPKDFNGLRVLLAEDNRTNRMLIRAFLSGLPLDLTCASDGLEAVEKTAEIAPDIVLMDMSMPGKDGLEATREIRRLSLPQPRIIALTANTEAAHQSACIEAGMDAFLAKPVQRADLLQELATQARHRPPR